MHYVVTLIVVLIIIHCTELNSLTVASSNVNFLLTEGKRCSFPGNSHPPMLLNLA